MKIQIANLNIVQLNYAVALAEGYKFGAPRRLPSVHAYLFPLSRPDWKTLGAVALYSDGWSDNVPWFCTGPAGDEIIDREKISVRWSESVNQWIAHMPYPPGADERTGVCGATRRIAAMRIRVQHKLGPEIEIHEAIK